MWLTEDEPMILGRDILGHPKKIAKVEVNKKGDEVVGTCERMGIRIATGRLKLEGPAPTTPLEPLNIFTLKAIPKSDYSGYEIKQLVCIPIMPDKAKENMMGKAEIVYKESKYDPVYEMKPVEILGGTWTVQHNTYYKPAYVVYDYLK